MPVALVRMGGQVWTILVSTLGRMSYSTRRWERRIGKGDGARKTASVLVESATHATADAIITELAGQVAAEELYVHEEVACGIAAVVGEVEAVELPAGSSSNNITCAGSLSPLGHRGQEGRGEEVHVVMEMLHLD